MSKMKTKEPRNEQLEFHDFESLFFNVQLMDDDSNDVQAEEKEFEDSKILFKEAKDSYNKVDDKLLEFIANFVENQDQAAKQKKNLKAIFFWFTMISFALIVVTPIVCLLSMMIATVDNLYVVFGAIIASVVEVLTTVIVLPKIVAEYLFNKKEENANIKIVKLMQNYSETMHGYDMDK